MCNVKIISAKAATGACKNTAPGYVKLWLAEQQWFDTFPAPEDFFTDPVTYDPLVISADITFDTVTYTTAGWYEWDLQPETGDWLPSAQGELGARYWQTTIPFKIAGHEALVDQAVQFALNARCVAMLEDTTGARRVIGNKSLYVSLNKADGSQGKKAGDFAGWDCELLLPSHLVVSPYYTGAMTPVYSL